METRPELIGFCEVKGMNTIIASKECRDNLTHLISPALKKASAPEVLSIPPHSLWQSPGGSLYRCINGEFICISVHSPKFLGWLNKAAIRNIQRAGNIWFADQAFRNMQTGELSSWEQISLHIRENQITKHFPVGLLKLTLVYGLTEVYTRVYEH